MELQVHRRDDATLLVLERPPVNALGIEAITALEAFFRGYDTGLPLVISGSGRAFSAGVDTTLFGSYSAAERADLFRGITAMTAALLAIGAPVVAAVNGHALGGGLVLALCTDYRIAAEGDARFGLPEARAGVPFPEGPQRIIASELPPGLLRRLALAGTIVSARELQHAGVFDELVAPDELLDTALSRAGELARQPAFGEVKAQVRGPLARRVAQLAGKRS